MDLDARDRVTVFEYDHLYRRTYEPALGRLETITDYMGQTIEYVYNTLGQLEFKKYYDVGNYPATPPTEAYQYVYDAMGRQDQVDYLVDSASILVFFHTDQDFTYDDEGRLTSLTTPQGTVHYDYSPITGRKVSTWTGPDVSNKITQTDYRYDDLGRLKETEVVLRDGLTVTGEITAYTYDANGNRKDITLGNGVMSDYTYDNLNRLTDVINSKTGNLSEFHYTLQADGQRSDLGEILGQPSGGNEDRTIVYVHDNLNRLTQESAQLTADSTTGYTIDYEYDLIGNRTLRHVQVSQLGVLSDLYTQYVYTGDGTDQLTQEIQTSNDPFAFTGRRDNYLAYKDGDGNLGYRLAGSEKEIRGFGAFIRGLPGKWSHWLYYGALAMIMTVFVVPLCLRRSPRRRNRLNKGIACLLIALFILSPTGLQTLANQSSQYSQLATTDWGDPDRTITYTYDTNGAMIGKLTEETASGNDLENVTYDYDHLGRLQTVTTTVALIVEVTDYLYNSNGIRIKAIYTKTDNGTQVEQKTTTYHIDPANHTGYAQVLEETVDGGTQIDRTTYDLPLFFVPVVLSFFT